MTETSNQSYSKEVNRLPREPHYSLRPNKSDISVAQTQEKTGSTPLDQHFIHNNLHDPLPFNTYSHKHNKELSCFKFQYIIMIKLEKHICTNANISSLDHTNFVKQNSL